MTQRPTIRSLSAVLAVFLGLLGLALASAASAEVDERNLVLGDAARPPFRSAPGALLGTPSNPQAVFDFPSDDSIVVGSVGFIDSEQVGYFWSVARGDSVTETFVGPATAVAYSLDVDVIENALNSGAFVNWDVIINGETVDNFTVNEGFLGTVSRSASFPAIEGPNYTVELRVTNEVAGGEGSHTFRYAGVGFHQLRLAENCELALTLERDRLRAGEDLRIQVGIAHHRLKEVTVPIRILVKSAAGRVLAERLTRPLRFEPGDRRQASLSISLPGNLPAGAYSVVVAIGQMEKGIARVSAPFEVIP